MGHAEGAGSALMKWLRAISYPYFSILFPADWEEQVKRRVTNWFAVKYPDEGPQPFLWRAPDFNNVDKYGISSGGPVAQVMVQDQLDHHLDSGGMVMQHEPLIRVRVADLDISFRVSDVGPWINGLRQKGLQPPREKYGLRFWDVVCWPGAVWMVPSETRILVDAVEALKKIEAEAEQAYKTFTAMRAQQKGLV